MNFEIKILPPDYRPEPELPDENMFEAMGEQAIRKMVSDHYDLLVESEIKDMFPPKGYGLEQAKERSADFFIQRLGGPDYFNQNRGAPMLSKRHSFFKVTPEGRMEWLRCYREVLQKQHIPDSMKQSFWNYLHDFSNWMVNTESKEQKFFMG